MIEGKVIKFGYGDVAVYGSGIGYIQFCSIKPPLECGQRITDEIRDDLEYGTTINLYEDNIWDIYYLMKTVSENNRIVTYKGYVLDFSNYNSASVKVVLDAAYHTVSQLALAC